MQVVEERTVSTLGKVERECATSFLVFSFELHERRKEWTHHQAEKKNILLLSVLLITILSLRYDVC